MGFSNAILAYIMSSYFELASGITNVGIFFTVSFVVFLIVLLNLQKIFVIFGKNNVFHFALLGKLVIIALLAFGNPSYLGVSLLMIYIVLGGIEWAALDVILEGFSIDKLSGRIRGLYLTVLNLGFIFGPSLSVYILEKMDFHGVFIFSFIFNAFVFIFSLLGFRKEEERKTHGLGILSVIKRAYKRKDVMKIYAISFLLEFFYALMVIYTFIYLINLGYSKTEIGEIFTVMLIPFVVLQYPLGFLADKKTGEKEFLIVALAIMGLSTIGIYLMGVGNIFLWAGVLFLTRVGAAAIEILRDSYFFKRVDGQDIDLINFFRTAYPVGFILATLIFSVLMLFVSMKTIFLLSGIIILLGLYPAWNLEDNLSEKEIR
jgi:MFS family permease